jgi:hypothetical protein
MGRFEVMGVPGVDGAGDAIAMELVVLCEGLLDGSGAGLLDEIRLAGRSIFIILPWGVRVNWPSFVFKL